MYYQGPDGNVYDDGRGDASRPYGLDASGRPYELAPHVEDDLMQRFVANHPPATTPLSPAKLAELVEIQKSRFPIGDVIARLTGAVGIQPCAPCKRRQEALNRAGDWGIERVKQAMTRVGVHR